MARIRTIKPDFFTHPSIVVLSVPARLLFVALWTQADDEGRLYDQPAKIRGLSFGDADKVSVDRLLEELAAHGRIVRYDALGRDCIEVVDFDQHQRINRPTPSAIPAPGLFTKPSANGQGVLTESSLGEGKGRERKGKEAAHAAAFVSFWETYPRKVGKRKAEAAFEQALRRADVADILEGAARYRDNPKRDPEFTAHPTTWLNADRWADEDTAAAPPRADRYAPSRSVDDMTDEEIAELTGR
jgi:hypothetical protein